MSELQKILGLATGLIFVCPTSSYAQECLSRIDPVNTKVEEALECIKSLQGIFPKKSDIPVGTIVAWYNQNEKIPQGWHVCDGSNGTPDLRGKFLQGVNAMSDAGIDPMGSASHSHTINIGPTQSQDNRGTHQGPDDLEIPNYRHDHPANIGNASNIPPNFKVVYLIKVESR